MPNASDKTLANWIDSSSEDDRDTASLLSPPRSPAASSCPPWPRMSASASSSGLTTAARLPGHGPPAGRGPQGPRRRRELPVDRPGNGRASPDDFEAGGV